MGVVVLELRNLKKLDDVAGDPEPDWSLDSLLSELNSLDKMLRESNDISPLAEAQSGESSNKKRMEKCSVPFVIRVSDEDVRYTEVDGEEDDSQSFVAQNSFHFFDICESSRENGDVKNELVRETQATFQGEVELLDYTLLELEHEHQLEIKDDILNQISSIEAELLFESEKCVSACALVETYKDTRRELERKLDTQYQRQIAEALDDHLTTVQRDHECKSQIEEKKLKSDAACEEVKKKEKAYREQILRQERARAEAESQAKRRAEETKIAALETKKREAKQVTKALKERDEVVSHEVIRPNIDSTSRTPIPESLGSGSNAMNKSQFEGNVLRAAKGALKQEEERLQKLKQLEDENQSLLSTSNMDFSVHERHIARLIRQIRGVIENVREKATELVSIFKNSSCPQSICIAAFVNMVLCYRAIPDTAVFACSHVTVLLASEIPHVMDLLLAMLNRLCIYTIPKHVMYSKSKFSSRDAYYKCIGYEESDGKMETRKDYLKRLEFYMKIYGSLVQTEVPGCENPHGLREGWAWLARFLNTLPANIYTAVALKTFLQAAGFSLSKKYKLQFRKLLNVIHSDYVAALQDLKDLDLNPMVFEIRSYIEDQKFLQEPESASFQASLLSHTMFPTFPSRQNFYY